ncbi:MAG: hypothetical protein JJ902_05550 [Roseibium sp.]|nr:hypothetical protein [Roseibium sp.]
MTAVLRFLLTTNGGRTALLLLAVGLALAAAQGVGYLRGKSDEATRNEIRDLKSRNDQLNERNETDAQVWPMDDRAICEQLGGVFIDGRCD